MVGQPERAVLAPPEAALVAMARAVTDRPWAVGSQELEQCRAAGLGDDAVLHAVVLSAFFNYLNRVADAIDLDYDYESPLPRPDRDRTRAPIPRPSLESWPARPALGLRLASRPQTAEAFARWRTYELDRDAPLSRPERALVVRAVAVALCDGRTVDEQGDARPRSDREETLAAYAERLTVTPWRLDEPGIETLRAVGFDDRGLLDVISLASFQNTASRLRLVLSE